MAKKSTFAELWAKLSATQKRYVMARQQYRMKKEAAAAAGVHANTVHKWPDYVEQCVGAMFDDARDAAQSIIEASAIEAAQIKTGGLVSEDEKIQQSAATELLDRVFGKPTARTEATVADVTPEPGKKRYSALSIDEKRTLLALMEKAENGRGEG